MHPLARKLFDWYRKGHRPLPWRLTRDPYKIWVSEVILQQTQVAVAIPYYKKFIHRFPTIRSLARSKESDALKAWEGLGYYARARNMRQAAQMIVQKYRGKLPQSIEQLQKIPGIGPYIAGAIASIAFNLPTPIVEGNVKRIVARLDALRKPIDTPATLSHIHNRVAALLPRNHPAPFNQALMELGQTICLPQNPICPHCPVRDFCKAYKQDIQNRLPIRGQKKEKPIRKSYAWLIIRNGRVLIEKRPSHGLLGGLWQIPLRSIPPQHGVAIGSVQKTYSHFHEKIKVIRVNRFQNNELSPHQKTRWLARESLETLALTGAAHKILTLVDHNDTL